SMLLRSTAASISRSASGFVRPAAAVRTSAPAPVPGRFRPPSPVLAALTRASASSVRIEVGCPTPVFHVRPFAPKWQLLWPRLTSDDPSRHLSTPVAQARWSDLPGYCALTFPLMPVGSTSRRSVQELGFASMGLLTPPCRLYPLPVPQASVLPTASFRFRLAPDPLAGCVEDFHLQVSAPCRAHQQQRPRRNAGPFAIELDEAERKKAGAVGLRPQVWVARSQFSAMTTSSYPPEPLLAARNSFSRLFSWLVVGTIIPPAVELRHTSARK